MACTSDASGSLFVKNFTGKQVALTLIKTTMDKYGDAIFASDGGLSVVAVGPTIAVPPTTLTDKYLIIGDWWPTWNGYTARTTNGLFASGALTGDGAMNYPTAMADTNSCNIGTVVLCTDKCVDSVGNTVDSTYYTPMTKNGKYYASTDIKILDDASDAVNNVAATARRNPMIVLLILILVVAVAIGGAVLYKNSRKS